MCTLTILRKADRTLVTMNRDEQKSRLVEKEPYEWPDQEVFGPQDTKALGTWCGINKNSRVACLLNGYQKKDQNREFSQSRGQLVPHILAAENVAEAMAAISCDDYPSFNLVVLEKGEIQCLSWDGQNVKQEISSFEDAFFITSSGYEPSIVQKARHDDFLQWKKKGRQFIDDLPQIHISRNNEDAAYNVLMDRHDACTKSITQYDIGGETSMVRYWSNPHKDKLSPKEFELSDFLT